MGKELDEGDLDIAIIVSSMQDSDEGAKESNHVILCSIHWFRQRIFNNNRKLIHGQLTGGGSRKVRFLYSSINNITLNLSLPTSNDNRVLTVVATTTDIDSPTVGAGRWAVHN